MMIRHHSYRHITLFAVLEGTVTEYAVLCVTHLKMSLTTGFLETGDRIHDAIVSETLEKTISTAKDVA